jgi:hypothetical protein
MQIKQIINELKKESKNKKEEIKAENKKVISKEEELINEIMVKLEERKQELEFQTQLEIPPK